jgi:hypothetical protein
MNPNATGVINNGKDWICDSVGNFIKSTLPDFVYQIYKKFKDGSGGSGSPGTPSS